MKKVLPAFLLLALAACTVHSLAEEAAAREGKLWRIANQRAAADCRAYPRSDRAKAMEADRCVGGIVREVVMPRAPFPDLVARLIEDQTAVSRSYHEGRITLQQANAEARQLQARYQAQVMERLHAQ